MRLHQMDFKCAFLNSIINEEVFLKQPHGFESDTFPNHVFKLKKELYGLKQAPCAWYEKLNDIIFCATNDSLYEEFSELMQKEFEMSMMGELLKKFNLEDCKTMLTPMHPTSILSLNEIDKKVDQTSYRSMIDSLFYLIVSRSYIMFSVCLCSRFQSNPRESHLTAIKRICRYLKGIANLDMCYKKSDQYRLKSYSNVAFALDRIKKKKHHWKMSLHWS
ncbi:hypothetical protein CR513_53050, partial [Mucuna pruriens]